MMEGFCLYVGLLMLIAEHANELSDKHFTMSRSYECLVRVHVW